MYYSAVSYLIDPLGNNIIDFEQRKKTWSGCILHIPPLIQWTIDDVKTVRGYVLWVANQVAYEYISDSWKLISASGLENLVEINNYQLSISNSWNLKPETYNSKPIYIIDNHNHAFYCRWKSHLEWKTSRWSHLIHIDQHSDLNEMSLYAPKEVLLGEGTKPIINKNSTLQQVAEYTNEVLDIASFIKPAKEIGLISNYEMILTEYSLLTMTTWNYKTMPLIVDIDLDFRAPEMSIENYDQTINQVRKLISLPQVQCITIATSPTYIDQKFAIKILYDILW